MKKYTGDFKTKARLKLLVNENNLGFIKNYKILYSDTFEISIDISQFEKPKGEVNGAIFNGYPFYFDEL